MTATLHLEPPPAELSPVGILVVIDCAHGETANLILRDAHDLTIEDLAAAVPAIMQHHHDDIGCGCELPPRPSREVTS